MMKRKALFSGTFDPFTVGHYSIIERALRLVDEIVIAVGVNAEKQMLYSPEERMDMIRKIYSEEKRIEVTSYDMLTVDFAKEIHADFLLRGVRSSGDFEYEKNMADTNRKLAGMETVILISEPEYEHVSSSLVRELIHYKKDITNLIPVIK
ncbi:MAG: pantetheine-phosphate adenylyltransferase [Tannerella sp.]|jgi:pantetheine-phosphate adenylyltransferase|nr:pantetheine-phosphate adenylyltransferase [Tannerella sp.]